MCEYSPDSDQRTDGIRSVIGTVWEGEKRCRHHLQRIEHLNVMIFFETAWSLLRTFWSILSRLKNQMDSKKSLTLDASGSSVTFLVMYLYQGPGGGMISPAGSCFFTPSTMVYEVSTTLLDEISPVRWHFECTQRLMANKANRDSTLTNENKGWLKSHEI